MAVSRLITLCAIVIAMTLQIDAQQWQQPSSSSDDCCDDYCYTNDNNPKLLFGSKTAYEFVHGRNSRQHIVPQCRPVQFWSVNRHGTRLPNEEAIRKISTILPKLRREIVTNYEVRKSGPDQGGLCYSDLDLLKQWQWDSNITLDHADWLTSQGKDDIKYLAKRYQTRFSELLPSQYSEQDFQFKYSDVQRIEESYKSYIEGLFNRDAYQVQSSPLSINESVLEGYKTCSAFDNAKEKQKSDENSEANRLIQKPAFQKLIHNVSRRLGFKYTLNLTSIQVMYEACRYEKAWHIRSTSAWCAAFTKDQLELLAYLEDLKTYYLTGYGNDIAQKLGCVGVKELLGYFEKTANDESGQPKAIIYFTHRQTLQMLLTALDFVKDPYALTADDAETSATRHRQWQTSNITPFAANLVAVFYKCKNNEKSVMFFLNENPVEYPSCQVGLCNWNSLYARLKSVADNCNSDFCERGAAVTNTITKGLLILVALISVKFFKY